MKKLLQFFSLATATQFCLLINQLGLLPLQLRVWGTDQTSQWFVVLAIANLTSATDLGLRNAGHSDLLESLRTGDPSATLAFRQTWALTRVFMFGLTIAFLGYERIIDRASFLLMAVTTIALAFDSILIVRNAWLDTLGRFNKVEGLFLAMVASRVALSILALALFQASPLTLAFIMLATIIPTIVIQTYYCTPAALHLLTKGFLDLRWRSLRVIPMVVAEPVTNWMRISLPVVVFASIAPPAFVTAYVGLRAVFGLARQVVAQLSRYASVIYVRRNRDAERIVIPTILASTVIGVAVSGVTIADHGRLLQLWLGSGYSPHDETLISLSLSAGIITFGYLVVSFILVRLGAVLEVAKRQYAYMIASGLTAIIGYFADSTIAYLVLLGGQEMFIAALFVSAFGGRVLRTFIVAFVIACGMLGLLVGAVRFDLGGVFDINTPGALIASQGSVAMMIVVMLGLLALEYRFAPKNR